MSVTGLFSGIGGFEIACAEAGFGSRLLVEIEPVANAVLRARFPKSEVRSDVLDLKTIPRGTAILTAGFPCQNLSMAGDKAGIEGRKSGIVTKLFELIERSRVPTVVVENVYFMLQLDSGRAMQYLVGQFERLGYQWAYRVLDTIGFGLPQRRRRVYLIASRALDPRSVLFADESPQQPAAAAFSLEEPLGFYWTEGRSGVGFTSDGVPPLKVGSSLGISSQPAVLFPDGEVLKPSIEAGEQLQGFPQGWTCVGSDEKARWRLVGNAVSVPVARWVAGRLRSPGAVLDFERAPLRAGQRWPDAAWNIGEGRVGVSASDKPLQVQRPSVSEFRTSSWTRLSDRALDGFIRRAVEGGLRMPDGFLAKLRKAKRTSPKPPAFPHGLGQRAQ